MKSNEPKLLLIAYGNELRGDDAAGPLVAETVTGWAVAGLRILTAQQLTPELADPISQADAVVFVDARLGEVGQSTTLSPLSPDSGGDFSAHRSNPASLLALSQALFGRCPPAWMLTIPALAFDYGAPLTPTTRDGVTTALTLLREWTSRQRTG